MVLTDETGTVAEEYFYDAWGQRRNPADWSQPDMRTNLLLDRGYTGHEHLDYFNLVNMNGRVYDPVLGRFLSPDPLIQATGFTQNYNRYTYCFNNPLKYTDPSGYNIAPTIYDPPFFFSYYGGGGRVGIPMYGSNFYRYNYGADMYFDRYGNNVSYEEALNGNYALYGGTFEPLENYGLDYNDVTNALNPNIERFEIGTDILGSKQYGVINYDLGTSWVEDIPFWRITGSY